MKVRCYREVSCVDDITILGLSSAEVPLGELLEQRLTNVDSRTHITGTEEALGRVDLLATPRRIRYRSGADDRADGVVEIEGAILVEGMTSLLAFLEERYLPDESSGHQVDGLLTRLRKGEITRSDWHRTMERALFDEAASRHRLSGVDRESYVAFGFVASRRGIESTFVRRHDVDGAYLLRSARHARNLGVVSGYTQAIDGHPVPRWRFAFLAEEEGVGGWDGWRFHVADHVEHLPDNLLRSLDREGRLVLNDWNLFLPMSDLRPELLVRVPYPSELRGLAEVGSVQKNQAATRPALFIDSRCPIRLEGNPELWVEEGPVDAVSYLARRTSRGVYVPGMPPAPIADLELSEEGQPPRYLVGCWPS